MIKRKNLRRFVALAIVIAIGGTAAACGGSFDERDLYAQSDWHLCIVDREDGTIEELPPSGNKMEIEDDAIVFGIPTSQRFFNASTTSKRDPGLPQFITGQDATYKPMRMEAESLLYFNMDLACEFMDRHMKRNVPQHILNNKDLIDKFGFNVRTKQQGLEYLQDPNLGSLSEEEVIARIPWFTWFRENIFRVMQESGETLLTPYAWEYYQFNFPVNADRDGVMPCISETEVEYVDPTNPENTETVTKCEETAPSEGLAKDLLEDDYGTQVTEKLTDKIDGQYFCGNLNTYQRSGQDDKDGCDPIVMDIFTVYADPDQVGELVNIRRNQIDLREKAENDLRMAEVTQDATRASLAVQGAQDDQTFQLRQQELADDERNNALDAAHAKNLQDAIIENDGIDPEVFEAEKLAQLEAVKAQAEAETKMLPCTSLNVPVSGFECALILIAYNGGTLPEGYMPSLNDYLSIPPQPQAAEPTE